MFVDERNFVVPEKCVKSVNDMVTWEKSTAYYDIIGFINAISQAIQEKKLTAFGLWMIYNMYRSFGAVLSWQRTVHQNHIIFLKITTCTSDALITSIRCVI